VLLGVVAVWHSVGSIGLIELWLSAIVCGVDSSIIGSCRVDSCGGSGVLGFEGGCAELF